MVTFKARVTNGRIVVDHPTDLPEGTEVRFVAVTDHRHDELDDRDRAALHRALADAATALREDRLVGGDEVLERLRSGG